VPGCRAGSPPTAPGDVEAGLAAAGVPGGVRFLEPQPGERPPTLIRYARWAQPVRGLLDMLGTVPGYDEVDVSTFFMVALPLFAGMLIGDAGYGLVFLLLPLLARGAAGRSAGSAPDGTAAGVRRGGTGLGRDHRRLVRRDTDADGGGRRRGGRCGQRAVLAAARARQRGGHAHHHHQDLLRARQYAPDPGTRTTVAGAGARSSQVAEVGWCAVLAAMAGVIWTLFFGSSEALPHWLRPAITWTLGAGLLLVVLFGAPHANPLRRIGMGIAGSLLPLLGTFSDTLSYIRLMAVGLASYYIGAAFNTLAASLAETATWAAGAPVLVFGHLLNLALVLIAIFAHGVRLNMLEFSSNAGVQWTGYPFRPFAPHPIKET
jgi:V/A-type H+/Na+-transporting ATPase subunit I